MQVEVAKKMSTSNSKDMETPKVDEVCYLTAKYLINDI